MQTLLSTLLLFAVIVLVHEAGHFLAAKWVGVRVHTFSLGFGPALWAFRRGHTSYVLSAIPLGGYVSLAQQKPVATKRGDAAADANSAPAAPTVSTDDTIPSDVMVETNPDEIVPFEETLESKSIPARMFIMAAGVLMNLLLAFAIFTVIIHQTGAPAEPRLLWGPSGQGVVVDQINGRPAQTWADLRRAAGRGNGPSPALTITLADGRTLQHALPSDSAARATALLTALPATGDPLVVTRVEPNSPAAAGGLQPGDRLLALDGIPLIDQTHLLTLTALNAGRPVALSVQRGASSETQRADAVQSLRVTPAPIPADAPSAGAPGTASRPARLGVRLAPRQDPIPVHEAAGDAARMVGRVSTHMVTSIAALFRPKPAPTADGTVAPSGEIGGPLMIGEAAGDAARAGWMTYLAFVALFSINIAIVNLLPISVLDGGQILLLGLEAVRGRPLSVVAQRWSMTAGMLVVLGLMGWGLLSDVLRLVRS